jgi:hypothetical protein
VKGTYGLGSNGFGGYSYPGLVLLGHMEDQSTHDYDLPLLAATALGDIATDPAKITVLGDTARDDLHNASHPCDGTSNDWPSCDSVYVNPYAKCIWAELEKN